jgi:hypothetical protein
MYGLLNAELEEPGGDLLTFTLGYYERYLKSHRISVLIANPDIICSIRGPKHGGS